MLKPLCDKDLLRKLLRRSWVANGKPEKYTPTPELVDVYWEALADLTEAELRLGFLECTKRLEYFPKPAEIRQHMDHALERMPRPVNPNENCPECHGGGWKIVERKERRFAVECDHGKGKSR